MAEMGYGCVFGDCQTQPNHMITTINPASTISTCDEHYAPALIPLLAAELGVDPGEFYARVERWLAAEAKKAEKALADAQAAEAAKDSQGPAADSAPSTLEREGATRARLEQVENADADPEPAA